MRRHIPGLHQAAGAQEQEIPDGFFLVRVERAVYRAFKDKPFLTLMLAVEEPPQFSACRFSARIYCTPKALWKLSWFLRDFAYDSDLLGRDEIDDKVMTGLHGVVKISHNNLNGRSYSTHDNWDRMLQGGMQLLDRFAQEDRVRILQPQANLQVKILRPLSGSNAFVSYVDAIGELDHELCVIDWKTSTACNPAEPAGLCALDPQMICYSWMTGIERVALVVFVRKRMPEIQYLKATISDQQRQEYGRLVEETVRQIEAAQFLQHSGIRFPQNPCLSCAYLGLCLDRRELVDLRLTRQRGADLDWLDQLCA